MTSVLIGLIIGILLITLIVFLVYWFLSSTYKPPSLSPCSNGQSLLTLPLWREGGVYFTRIHLGTPNRSISFNVVPDTGSNTLILSGPNCQKCDRGDGVWDPSLGSNVSGGFNHRILFAGGQTTTYVLWRALLLDYIGGKEVDFGMITSSGTPEGTPLNVLGLQRNGFIQQLCGPKNILFDFPRGQLYIGNINDKIPPNALTFTLDESEGSIKFVLGRITSMNIDGRPVPPSITPRRAIFDTGSTNTYVSYDLLKYLSPGSHRVEITFDNEGSTPTTVIFDSPAGSVESGSLPISSSMMIGHRWLSNYAIAFKYENHKIQMYT